MQLKSVAQHALCVLRPVTAWELLQMLLIRALRYQDGWLLSPLTHGWMSVLVM